MRTLLIALALIVAALTAMPAAPALAAPAHGARSASLAAPARLVALRWARTRAGAWYAWGGTGPGYDCSGLVMMAYRHAGIWLPHSTYAMLASGKLIPIPLSWARPGDLLFYGSGHVELATREWHTSFGALESGTRIGWHRWGGWWAPTMAFRVR